MNIRLAFYDIEEDNIRNKVSNKLEEFGFIRLQYSVYAGRISKVHLELCYQAIADILAKSESERNKFSILLIEPEELRKMLYLGNKPETDEILVQKWVEWF